MVKVKRILIFGFASLILVAIGLSWFVWQKVASINDAILSVPPNYEYTVNKGSNLYKIQKDLSQYTKLDPLGFKIWVRLHPEFTDIKAGLYDVPDNTRFVDFVASLAAGDEKQFSVTLIEGFTVKQWLDTLKASDGLLHDVNTLSDVYEALITSDDSHCVNDYQSVEGCLLPNTYFYTLNTPASTILKRAYRDMQAALNELWPQRFLDIPLSTQYETLILASIIEKETSIEQERAEIAGVFTNRLQQNMRLQTDPTVIYGIGPSFDGNITRKHLRTPTPYNTYVIKGLPITPIAMPSAASVKAALQPNLTDSLYFVATGTGGHQFSTNLADHNKAVREYLEVRKQLLQRNQNPNDTDN